MPTSARVLTSESIFLSLLVMSRVTFLSPAVMSPPLLSSANMLPPAGLEGAAVAGFGASTGAAADAAAGLGAAALLLLNSVALPPCHTHLRPTHWAEPSVDAVQECLAGPRQVRERYNMQHAACSMRRAMGCGAGVPSSSTTGPWCGSP